MASSAQPHQYQWRQIPALADNYIYIILDDIKKQAVVIDPALSAPVLDFLAQGQYDLVGILLTHHHHDHVGGVLDLQTQYQCPLYAPFYDIKKNRIPHDKKLPLHGLSAGDGFHILGLDFTIISLAGHTLGQVGYYCKAQKWFFSGDAIFSMGCGYLFEGSYDDGFQSLANIKNLPPDVLLFIAHEYSAANIKFAGWFFGDTPSADLTARCQAIKKLRARQQPTVPIALSVELSTNPFLQVNNIDEFKKLREAKNNF